MGLSSTLIILGLIAGVVYANNPEVLQVGAGGIIQQKDGQTYLANEAGQIFKRADGKTVLIGANGQQIVTDGDDSDEDSVEDGHNHSFNNVIINGQNINGGDSYYQTGGKGYMFVTVHENSYLNSNGHSVKVVNGGLQLVEGGQEYTFLPRAADVNETKKVDINGQPATVEFSGGNVIIELADGTLIAKLGDRVFLGDRQSFNNREQLALEASQQAAAASAYAAQLQKELSENLSKTMEKLHHDLQQTLGNLRF